jgi:hypothetical protein
MRVNFNYIYYADVLPKMARPVSKRPPDNMFQYLSAIGPRFHKHVREYLRAEHAKFIRRQVPESELTQNVYCGPASWILAFVLDGKFGLPIGGKESPRLEIMESVHVPTRTGHVRLKYLPGGESPQILIDPTAGQFDRSLYDQIYFSALPQGMLRFPISSVLDYLTALIASARFTPEERPSLETWLAGIIADYNASFWQIEFPPEPLRFESGGFLVSQLHHDKGFIWDGNTEVIRAFYMSAQAFLAANPG